MITDDIPIQSIILILGEFPIATFELVAGTSTTPEVQQLCLGPADTGVPCDWGEVGHQTIEADADFTTYNQNDKWRSDTIKDP